VSGGNISGEERRRVHRAARGAPTESPAKQKLGKGKENELTSKSRSSMRKGKSKPRGEIPGEVHNVEGSERDAAASGREGLPRL